MSELGRMLIKSLKKEDVSTWTLYKDKPLFERLRKVIYLSDILNPVLKSYYAAHSFITNCKRVIKYFPIVWKHRNWDYGFVLRFNIQLHEDLYKGCFVEGHHVYTKNDARKLKTVIELLKRLEAEDYSSGHDEYLDKKYGKSDIYFSKVIDEKTERKYTTIKDRREDNMTPEQLEVYNKERMAIYKHEEYQRNEDFKLLGEYIRKYSKKWWD